MRRFVSFFFLVLLVGLPVGQALHEWSQGERIHVADVWRRDAEDELRERSLLAQRVVPAYKEALLWIFGYGGSRVIAGRGGWLFLAEDVEVVTGRGWLEPGRGGARAIEVIAAFDAQLAERGISLFVMPVPTKAMTDPGFLSARAGGGSVAAPDQERFVRELRKRGVRTLDVSALLAGLPSPRYLRDDTHWSPESMRAAARHAAVELRRVDRRLAAPGGLESDELEVRGRGDLVRMLGASEPQMTLRVRPVRDAAGPLEPDRNAPLLLLGDSFTRVFSDPELELGAHAGFAEQLALELGAPLDVIAVSGGGASAVREALARRGAGALAGKRVVLWQFSMREIVAGEQTWSEVELGRVDEPTSGADTDAQEDARDEPLRVVAELVELSHVSEDFDYEFSLAVFEYRVIEVLAGTWSGEPLWVAHAAFRDFKPTRTNEFEVGERHTLTLEPLEGHYSLERTPWVDDTDAGARIYWPTDWSR